MAKTKDIAAEKARKQKIILVVAGVLMVAIAVIQVPKLMKKDTPAAAPEAATATDAAATAPGAATPAPTTPAVANPAGYVAGVALPGTSVTLATTSKLASFTLFEPKDPFVQQVGEETAAATADAGIKVAPSDAPAAAAASEKTPATKPTPLTYATVMFNDQPQQLQLKQKFPEADPTFVLVSLKKKQAKIGVVGGTFGDGKNLTLVMGETLTLLNTATGVRHELKLVYTGTAPEQIESFTRGDGQSPPADGGTTAPAPATATP